MIDTSKYLKKLWTDKCTVVERREKINTNTTTGYEEIVVLQDEKCKLSFGTAQPVEQTSEGAKIHQPTKLFISNEINIKAGSKITVTRGERNFVYESSGEPNVFSNHQEIALLPFEGWA